MKTLNQIIKFSSIAFFHINYSKGRELQGRRARNKQNKIEERIKEGYMLA